ncbi:recombinase family protein [Cupriavidus nantongensis]|uniref:recombinase family protein n=1 Tax=Cupriavidus nantongensis TaxID=1796606 RepID=UPI0009EF2DB4|nr:recombinase family protein [Cupriavidus nantongensis]
MRALIYSRFSSDKQRESSIEDQVRICRARCEAEGCEVVAEIGDEGISGSTPVSNRPAGAKLLADALAERFDVLVLEGLDRLARDQVEQERIVRRLEHRGIRIIGVSDGYDSKMGSRKIMRGVRGLINELYLDDLRHKTHRGQEGQFERGFIVGGKSYGYDIVRDAGGSRYQVNQEEARHVRWIFEKYAAGWSARRIAYALNEMRVPSPRGRLWAVSAIFGSAAKGSGLLSNELYVGRYIWNRSQWIKDPDTGKRQRVERPESEWHRAELPDLQIVDDETWLAVRARMDAPRLLGGRGKGQAPRTLFSGMLRCALCGAPVVSINSTQYGCINRKDRGPTVCPGVAVARDRLDTRLLALVRDELFSQAALGELEQLVRATIAERQKASSRASKATRERLAELDAEIGRLVDAIAKVGMSDSLQKRLMAAEAEKAKLAVIPSAVAPAALANVTDLMALIKRRILSIQEALRQGDTARARTVLADIFGPITLVRRDDAVYAEFATSAETMLLAASGKHSLVSTSGPRNQPHRCASVTPSTQTNPPSAGFLFLCRRAGPRHWP